MRRRTLHPARPDVLSVTKLRAAPFLQSEMVIMLGASHLAALATDVPKVIRGDVGAWSEFLVRLEPQLFLLLRRSRAFRPLRHDMEECRAVMFTVLQWLSTDNFGGLRMWAPWATSHPGRNFGDWIQIVTDNLAREHVSSRLRTMAT